MTHSPPPDASYATAEQRGRALLVMRIIWAALLIGPLAFMAVVIFTILPKHQTDAHPQPVLIWTAAIMFLTVVPAGFMIRRVMFRPYRDGQGVPPNIYGTGNIILWAACEGVAFFGLIVATLNGTVLPTLGIVLMSLGLQAITFPKSAHLSTRSSASL